MGEVANINIPLNWKAVLVNGTYFEWHKHPPRNIRERDLISGPRVYRWLMRRTSGEIELVYVGQTERFEKRVSEYRGGKQSRVEPVSTFLSTARKCEDSGGSVELQFLDLDKESFSVNGKAITNASLGDHDVRLMMEGIALVDARARNLSVLNRLHQNVHIKDLRRIVNQNPKVIERIQQNQRSEQV